MIAHASQIPENFNVTDCNLSVIRVSGDDRITFLQGQLTQDLNRLSDQQALRACHCDAKGKMWSTMLLVPWQESILLIMDTSAAEKSLAELKKYGVFSKVQFSTEHSLSVMGMVGEKPALTGDISLPSEPMAVVANNQSVIVRLEGELPRFLWIGEQTSTAENLQPGVLWTLTDILAGIATVTATTQSEYVPQQINMQALNAISFTKGCYMGQETVARTKYLGRNKRAAYLLKSDTAVELASGAGLEIQLGDNWRVGGSVLNCATLGAETWIMAVLPNDTETGAVLRSKETPDATFTVQPLPYSLDEQ